MDAKATMNFRMLSIAKIKVCRTRAHGASFKGNWLLKFSHADPRCVQSRILCAKYLTKETRAFKFDAAAGSSRVSLLLFLPLSRELEI